jgi:hypothetical protein
MDVIVGDIGYSKYGGSKSSLMMSDDNLRESDILAKKV